MATSRPSISLDQAQAPFFVGIDLGGTNIKVGLVDDLGRTLAYLSVPTEVDAGPVDGAMRIARAALAVIAQAGLQPQDVARAGLGSPGTMDLAAGLLIDPINLKGWQNFPLRDHVQQHCGLRVTFANDASAATYGEYWAGGGQKFRSLVLYTLGTGIGGGIIVDGQSIDGDHSTGAECGHIIIDSSDTARVCNCGQLGHLEAYASGIAVVKRTREALAAGRASSLSTRLDAGAELTPLLVAQEAEREDPLALEIVLETARYMGIGIVSVMHTIDPSGVLLGGAMTFGGHDTKLGRRFLEHVRQEVQRRALPIPAAQTTIDYATLGSDAGYIGAAGLARREFRLAEQNKD